jgi:O-antigen/teichoic acid export membrane protein
VSFKSVIRNISIRDIGTVALGATISQIIAVVSIPLLTRIYTPEDFGAYSVYSAILAILAVTCTLRYELAIPLPQSEVKAYNLRALSLIITILFSVFTLIMVLIAQLLGVVPSFMSNLVWLLPISVLITGFYQVFTYQLIREKKFKTLSKLRVSQSILILVFQLILFKLSQLGLALAQTISQICSMLMCKHSIRPDKTRKLSFGKLICVVREFKKFPYFSLPTSLVNSAGQHLPSLIIATMFGTKFAGIYFLTSKLVSLPIRVLGGAISNVFVANAREQKKVNNLRRFSLDYLIVLLCIIVPVVVIVILFGETLIICILGEEWREAGKVLEWLIIIGSTQFITSPIGQILMIKDRQETGLFWQAVLSILKISGLMVGVYHEDFILGIICYSLLGSVGYISFLMVSIKNA